ncbi:hypothetical protein AVEN_115401-1 [Araneus ventricosus]|uniref:Uncharacterized protein n=1 Tax=Araneus ventricosus TaxID=182803 RepID=A0A4Y1ZYD9_ARAVE|nr:hypothetical protein AVEN_115401-1 [Araneus ventricosus]
MRRAICVMTYGIGRIRITERWEIINLLSKFNIKYFGRLIFGEKFSTVSRDYSLGAHIKGSAIFEASACSSVDASAQYGSSSIGTLLISTMKSATLHVTCWTTWNWA